MTVKKTTKGYVVISRKGTRLTKPDQTRAAALKDLRRIEFYKRKGRD